MAGKVFNHKITNANKTRRFERSSAGVPYEIMNQVKGADHTCSVLLTDCAKVIDIDGNIAATILLSPK